ncbi:MAG: phosphoribosylformylglycinamidine synthase subunit PurS [Thermoprotei archaeon]|jgi:phosphoribosylformylglycinamidine synthase
MPCFIAKIEVWLKEGLVDAEGKAITEALNDLRYPIIDVSVGKIYKLLINAADEEHAYKIVDEICKRLLTNPVKDRYSFTVKTT